MVKRRGVLYPYSAMTMAHPEITPLLELIKNELAAKRPILVVIDGRSGVGKSTLAAAIAKQVAATVIDEDDFFAGGLIQAWKRLSPQKRAEKAINWARIRQEALEPLLRGEKAVWRSYDWDHDRLSGKKVAAEASDVIILEGAYSSRPEIADLYRISVLVTLDESERLQRVKHREGEHYNHAEQLMWDEAEEYYFSHTRPPASFDLIMQRTTD